MANSRGDDSTQQLPLDVVGDDAQSHAQTAGTRQDGGHEQNLVAHMARFRTDPLRWLQEVGLFVSGTGWRAYEDVVGQPVFYSGYTEKIKAATMASPKLQQKMADLVESRLEAEESDLVLDASSPTYAIDKSERRSEVISSLSQVVFKMVDDMVCKMESRYFIRGAYYVCTQLLTRAYHQGIHVDRGEIDRLRAIARTAAARKQSIIFLPNHKSHLDYVSLQLICFRLGITLPVVVAGDNLNFPLVGSFLQHAGAMWIRRSFAGDALYNTLVQSYLDTMLQQGYNLECFVEGGRSRTGKLLQPKFGILSFLLDSVMSGRVEDAYVCPVSSQYDKVLEVDSYVSELLGQPKQKENLRDFLSSSSALSLKLGRVDVRFHQPWSLRDFINSQQHRPNHDPNQSGTKALSPAELRARMLRTLGYRVLSDINDVSVVMPTALVGTVLLTLRGRGVGMSELVRRVDWLSDRIKAKGGRVAHFHGAATQSVVERALEVLGSDLVGSINGLAEPTYYAVDRFQLSFYRNMTIHLFVSEALVAVALYTRVKQGGGPANQSMSRTELTQKVTFLSQLFRGEFIFPAGEGLGANLEKAAVGLQADSVIQFARGEDGELHVGLTDTERMQGRENYDFYCFLIWPFVEAAWLGAVSLICLTPPLNEPDNAWLDMKQVQDTAQLLGKTLYHQGDLSYFEAVNKEALKNAYARVEEEGIIVVAKSKDSKTGPRVRLATEWTPGRSQENGRVLAGGRLWDFIERIAQCRREGKNRRDGATVATRVLALTSKLGLDLFTLAEAEADVLEEVLVPPTRPVRRRSKI